MNAADVVGVFFQPVTQAADITPVEALLAKDPEVGLVGYVDQAAGYQEFQTIFRGTDQENVLAQQDIPPSLRVFTSTVRVAALKARVSEMAGVLKVTDAPIGGNAAAGELGPIAGFYDIGTVVYEQAGWAQSCEMVPWNLNHPLAT